MWGIGWILLGDWEAEKAQPVMLWEAKPKMPLVEVGLLVVLHELERLSSRH